jgi:hypothetical protein
VLSFTQGEVVMAKAKVSLLVNNDNLHRLDDVVKGAGMDVDQILKSSGVVTGVVDSRKLATLKKIKGVSSVEAEREFQIAPPGSDLQ